MIVDTVYLADPMGRPRPHVRVFATIEGRRFELVRLDKGAPLEVYDHPRAWRGLPRFVGYASIEHADHLEAIARRAVDRVAVGVERFGREHVIGGAL